MDIQIDDEIITYWGIGGDAFVECLRGRYGTRRAPHRKGAKIYHLSERYGCYPADLRTSLNDEIADGEGGIKLTVITTGEPLKW